MAIDTSDVPEKLDITMVLCRMYDLSLTLIFPTLYSETTINRAPYEELIARYNIRDPWFIPSAELHFRFLNHTRVQETNRWHDRLSQRTLIVVLDADSWRLEQVSDILLRTIYSIPSLTQSRVLLYLPSEVDHLLQSKFMPSKSLDTLVTLRLTQLTALAGIVPPDYKNSSANQKWNGIAQWCSRYCPREELKRIVDLVRRRQPELHISLQNLRLPVPPNVAVPAPPNAAVPADPAEPAAPANLGLPQVPTFRRPELRAPREIPRPLEGRPGEMTAETVNFVLHRILTRYILTRLCSKI